MRLIAATDGACSGNPGPGGWAWVTSTGDQDWASARQTTNNRMELRALLELLLAHPDADEIEVQTDSRYVQKVFEEWLPVWRQRGMRTSSNKPVENIDLIEAIDAELQNRSVQFVWVKGHAGHPLNSKADELAQFAAQRAKRQVELERSKAG